MNDEAIFKLIVLKKKGKALHPSDFILSKCFQRVKGIDNHNIGH